MKGRGKTCFWIVKSKHFWNSIDRGLVILQNNFTFQRTVSSFQQFYEQNSNANWKALFVYRLKFCSFQHKCCIFNFRNLTGKVLSISKVELQVKKQVFIWIIHSNLYFRGERYRFECYLEIYTSDLEISIYIWILTPNLFHATTK